MALRTRAGASQGRAASSISARAVQQRLRALADPQTAEILQRFFKTNDVVAGERKNRRIDPFHLHPLAVATALEAGPLPSPLDQNPPH